MTSTSTTVAAALSKSSKNQNMVAPPMFDCSPKGYNTNQTLSTPTGGGVDPRGT